MKWFKRHKAAFAPDAQHTYFSIVRNQFYKNKLAVFALHIIYVLMFIFLFADFLANDKPLIMHYNGNIYFPVFREYGVNYLNLNWQDEFKTQQFKLITKNAIEGDWAIYPPVPYSPMGYDLTKVLSRPGSVHLLGTDELGRDLLSQMIHGSRVSLLVGFVSVSIYVMIGVFLGALAGYYGGWVDIVIQRVI